MKTVVILDYSIGEVDVYTISDDLINNETLWFSWIKQHYYDIDEIDYMFTDDLKINVHKNIQHENN